MLSVSVHCSAVNISLNFKNKKTPADKHIKLSVYQDVLFVQVALQVKVATRTDEHIFRFVAFSGP